MTVEIIPSAVSGNIICTFMNENLYRGHSQPNAPAVRSP